MVVGGPWLPTILVRESQDSDWHLIMPQDEPFQTRNII